MKNLNVWFNALAVKQQRRLLILFVCGFALLLIASFWLPWYWNTGQPTIPAHIGQASDIPTKQH